ncbi:hypothetical protein NA57DRAFT_72049 [Rhizodiscina lignyota]|uniref:BRCT domain-containing protein n=1 Tax=Rhizodiscina lignyota TaxID=1504668 RepID=A0A9P4IKZ1_9PEZI|nr:hypothetical protein NA57DRAFT_72049 [Rhizodiscina lignyota]
MPPVTRARAKATDKPQSQPKSPLKNILKAPARRAAKAKTTTPTTSGVTKPTKKAPAKTAAKPRSRKAKAELELEKAAEPEAHAQPEVVQTAEQMEGDQVMVDAPLQPPEDVASTDAMPPPQVSMVPSQQQTPVRPSKIPKPSPKTSPAISKRTTPPPGNDNSPLKHRISATRLAQTSVVKKASKEGLLSRSPLKSSYLSLQTVLSQSPKKTPKAEPESPRKTPRAYDATEPVFKAPTPSMADDDDVFQSTAKVNMFKSASLLSPIKSSFGSPRKPPTKEKYLSASPFRKNRSPQHINPPKTKTPAKSPPCSPSLMAASMMQFSELFPGIPSSPVSSPDRSIFQVPSSPRKPLAEMPTPMVPPRSSSKSPKKHNGEPLVSRSPSKVPRLSPSKSSLRSNGSGSAVPVFGLAPGKTIPPTPSKSSLRSSKENNYPPLSTKKSVTWTEELPIPQPAHNLLTGLVFYVDVRTADGADAGHLFTPLLVDLGAEVVPSWTSNFMDVTHVLFKDGDDRTLEKVVASGGMVSCVNVGWAVDCERFNCRLPESDYAIDLSRIPGQTPTTSPAATPAPTLKTRPLSPTSTNHPPATPVFPRTPAQAPTLDINNNKIAITTPAFLAAGSKTVGAKSTSVFNAFTSTNPSTTEEDKENIMPDDRSSPATPYFLHPGEIVQKTCPPKAHSGREPGNVFLLEDADTPFRQRLLLAKRKSLEWAPKIGSPLRNSTGGEGF